MPSSCCVPDCHQKGDFTAAGTKVNYFSFPEILPQKKVWIYVIRRDEGKHLTITYRTKVCSLQFRISEDFRRSLKGRIFVRDRAVLSKFPWSVPSPHKRKPPRKRENPVMTSPFVNFSLESAALVTSATKIILQQEQPECSTNVDCEIVEEPKDGNLSASSLRCQNKEHLAEKERKLHALSSRLFCFTKQPTEGFRHKLSMFVPWFN